MIGPGVDWCGCSINGCCWLSTVCVLFSWFVVNSLRFQLIECVLPKTRELFPNLALWIDREMNWPQLKINQWDCPLKIEKGPPSEVRVASVEWGPLRHQHDERWREHERCSVTCYFQGFKCRYWGEKWAGMSCFQFEGGSCWRLYLKLGPLCILEAQVQHKVSRRHIDTVN